MTSHTRSASGRGWGLSLLLMAVLALVAATLSVALSALAEAVYESGLLAFDRPFTITWWWVLPTLSLACLALGVAWRRRPRRWLLLLATLPPLAWAGLALYRFRLDGYGWYLLYIAWLAVAVVALLAAVALPTGWKKRPAVALWGLSIPVPFMAIVLILISLAVVFGRP
jgi:hypothetical protein